IYLNLGFEMKMARIYILLSALLFSLCAVAAPLCSNLFTHDFGRDPYADINHQGALDLIRDLDRTWMFQPKWAPSVKEDGQAPSTLPLSAIRFMQGRVSNNYSDSRYTVISNAR